MINRPRRLRKNDVIRNMVAETAVNPDSLVYPMFVVEGEGIKELIPSMPGQYRFSVDELLKEVSTFGTPSSSMNCWPTFRPCASS